MAHPISFGFKIRDELRGDHDAIHDLIRTAFHGHPHHPPGTSPFEHLIVDELRFNGKLALSLVAVHGESIVGHVAFSPIRIDGAKSEWYGLGPVAVHPHRQHRGVGTALINKGLEDLVRQNAEGVVVLGNPDFYRRFGFVVDPNLVLENVPAEYFLARRFTQSAASGIVTYHDAFSITSDDDQV